MHVMDEKYSLRTFMLNYSLLALQKCFKLNQLTKMIFKWMRKEPHNSDLGDEYSLLLIETTKPEKIVSFFFSSCQFQIQNVVSGHTWCHNFLKDIICNKKSLPIYHFIHPKNMCHQRRGMTNEIQNDPLKNECCQNHVAHRGSSTAVKSK